MKRRFLLAGLFLFATIACSTFSAIPNRILQPETDLLVPTFSNPGLPDPEVKITAATLTAVPVVEHTLTPAALTPNGSENVGSSEEQTPVGLETATKCGEALIARVSTPLEFTKDLFEHHAQGVFLIVILEMQNLSPQPIQIWDGDYIVEAQVTDKTISYPIQKAATGYLFITRGKYLSQDQIKPGEKWATYLAFDVDPHGTGWTLVVKPGYEINQQICEVQIALTE